MHLISIAGAESKLGKAILLLNMALAIERNDNGSINLL